MQAKHDMANALRKIRDGLREYAAAHKALYGAPIADDPIMGGEHWRDIASGLIGLLTGEAGTMDRGAFDTSVRSLARANGFGTSITDEL